MKLKGTSCCGLWDFADISTAQTPKEMVQYAASIFRSRQKKAFVMFTGVIGRVKGDHASSRPDNYGQALSDYITFHNLGQVWTGPSNINESSGNRLQVWVWVPNYPACEEVYRKDVKNRMALNLKNATYDPRALEALLHSGIMPPEHIAARERASRGENHLLYLYPGPYDNTDVP